MDMEKIKEKTKEKTKEKIKIAIGTIICLLFLTETVAASSTVIITFDDGWRSVLDNASGIMKGNNQPGVEFIITGEPEQSWNGQPENYMNVSQLQELYNLGWDLSSHTVSHVDLTTLNSTALNYELGASKDWLDNHGFSKGAMFLAYPYGANNSVVIAAAQANHYVAARTVVPPDANYPNYNLASPDVFLLKDYEAVGGVDNALTIMNQINNTVAVNGTLILSFHKIVNVMSTNVTNAEEEFLTSDFSIVSDYLKTLSNNENVAVTTLSGYFGAVPLQRYVPPTPINVNYTIKESLATSWINVSWSPGIGDKTDIYNIFVNNIRLNDTVDTFENITVVPGESVNMSVYAVNITNGNTLNLIPAYLNLTIPLLQTYTPSTPTNLTATNGNVTNGRGTILIKWQQGMENMTNATGSNLNATDFYNMSIDNIYINGTLWINTTNNSYTLNDVIPGSIYEIRIYAYNTTNGITINDTPGAINAIIPVYEPPTPVEVNESYGNFWGYFEWKNGTGINGTIGNTTDFYNVSVNGVWTNLTTNKSVNITTVPHGHVNISVYAYNSSNGGVQNPNPLDMYLQIPNNSIYIIDGIWAEYDIYSGDTLRINPVVYNPDNDTYTFTTNATNATLNNTTGEFIYNTSKNEEGTHYWNITVKNNYSVDTINFTVVITRPVSDIGSGGGSVSNGGGDSGGGGYEYDPNTAIYERRDSQIRNNTDSAVEFFKNGLVTNVTFHGVRNYGEVTVQVSVLKDNPTPSYLDNSYKFFSVNLDNIQQKNEHMYISNSTVIVLVNKSNLTDHIIKAYRFVNDSWIAIEIEDMHEDMHVNNISAEQFKLKSDGLSNFAIVLEPKDQTVVDNNSVENNMALSGDELTGNKVIDKAIKQIIPESWYRRIINLIKRYMWWI